MVHRHRNFPHPHREDLIPGNGPHAAPFLTQGEAAALLRLSGRTLERHRVSGTGPVFVRLGRRIVYRPGDLMTWAEAHTYRSTSEARA